LLKGTQFFYILKMLEPVRGVLGAGCWVLGAGGWGLVAGCWLLVAGCLFS